MHRLLISNEFGRFETSVETRDWPKQEPSAGGAGLGRLSVVSNDRLASFNYKLALFAANCN